MSWFLSQYQGRRGEVVKYLGLAILDLDCSIREVTHPHLIPKLQHYRIICSTIFICCLLCSWKLHCSITQVPLLCCLPLPHSALLICTAVFQASSPLYHLLSILCSSHHSCTAASQHFPYHDPFFRSHSHGSIPSNSLGLPSRLCFLKQSCTAAVQNLSCFFICLQCLAAPPCTAAFEELPPSFSISPSALLFSSVLPCNIKRVPQFPPIPHVLKLRPALKHYPCYPTPTLSSLPPTCIAVPQEFLSCFLWAQFICFLFVQESRVASQGQDQRTLGKYRLFRDSECGFTKGRSRLTNLINFFEEVTTTGGKWNRRHNLLGL